MFDVFIFANLRLRMSVALHAAFDIGRILKRRGEFLFLFLAMRTPIGSIHFDAAIAQAARKRVVLMLTAMNEIIGQSKGSRYQRRIRSGAAPLLVRGINPQPVLLPFSSLLRHGCFISRFYTQIRAWSRRVLYAQFGDAVSRVFAGNIFIPLRAEPTEALRWTGTPA